MGRWDSLKRDDTRGSSSSSSSSSAFTITAAAAAAAAATTTTTTTSALRSASPHRHSPSAASSSSSSSQKRWQRRVITTTNQNVGNQYHQQKQSPPYNRRRQQQQQQQQQESSTSSRQLQQQQRSISCSNNHEFQNYSDHRRFVSTVTAPPRSSDRHTSTILLKDLDLLKKEITTLSSCTSNHNNDSRITSLLVQIQNDFSSHLGGFCDTTKQNRLDLFASCIDIIVMMSTMTNVPKNSIDENFHEQQPIIDDIDQVLSRILDFVLEIGKKKIDERTTLRLPIPEVQLQQAVTVLTKKCRSRQHHSTNLMFLPSLAQLIQSYFKQFASAENTAQDIVGNIFLPILLTKINNVDDEMTTSSSCDHVDDADSSNDNNRILVLRTLLILLDDSRQGSAILGSLVQNVTSDGKEEIVVNPLRFRLIVALQTLIIQPSSGYDGDSKQAKSVVKALACTILAQVVNVLKKSKSATTTECNLANDTSLDIPRLENFILTSIHDESRKSTFVLNPCLDLFHSLLQYQPSAVSGLVSKLITSPTWDCSSYENSFSSSHCQYGEVNETDLSKFVQLIHLDSSLMTGQLDAIDKNASTLAVSCLTLCIDSMPWKRWLGLATRTTTSPRKALPLSGFGRRLADSLAAIINVIRCNFITSDFRPCSDDDKWLDSISKLAKCALIKLPFGNGDDKVTKAAVNLLIALSDIAFDRHAMESTPKRKKAAFEVLIYSMGGWETPQGSTVPMCIPSVHWLSNPNASLVILKAAFESAKSSTIKIDISVRFISAILRTRPETASELETDMLDLIRIGLESRENSNIKRFQILGILEAFMVGRKSTLDNKMIGPEGGGDYSSSDRIALSVLSFLRNTSRGDDASVKYRCLVFNTYAAFLSRDWIALAQVDEGIDTFNDHFQSIILHCHQESNAIKVRVSSCKALAEFCTAYFSSGECSAIADDKDITLTQNVARCVCETMLANMNDENAAIRAMSHFCVGNLGYSIRKTNYVSVLDESILLKVCTKTQKALQDQNEKVVGNAIRSIGYWGLILSRNDVLDLKNVERIQIQQLILDSLNVKLARAISLVSTERQPMTWKQRSVAKKHGWGAANATSLLFQHSNVDPSLFKSYLDVLGLLMTCAEKFVEVNEKISFSAAAAIRSLSSHQLSELTRGSGLVGNGIVSCVLRIHQAKGERQLEAAKAVEEYTFLLRHLLDSATVLDASIVLRSDEMSNSQRHYLYHWMVANDAGGHSFQVFALAFQRPGLKETDAMLEQNFASRARQRDNQHVVEPTNKPQQENSDDEL